MEKDSLNFGDLEILYQDNDLIAIDKPAGLLVHRRRIDISAREFAVQKLRDQIGRPVFLVHRLDRPTSGVLLFAFSSEIAKRLCEQFSERSVTKEYEAIVRGHAPESGCWDEPLVEKPDRMTDGSATPNKDAQSAVTKFQTLAHWTIPFSTKTVSATGKYNHSRYSHVRIQPLTGRRHQIRRHFNHMSHPIVGDTTHGDRRHNRLVREIAGVSRMLLVARSLSIVHPETGKQLTFRASLGVEFQKLIEFLNLQAVEANF